MNTLALKSIDRRFPGRGTRAGRVLDGNALRVHRACCAIPALRSRCWCCRCALYALFALLIAGEAIDKDPNLGIFLFAAFSIMAVTMPALFGIGVTLALERDMGLLRLKRAQPAPPAAWVVAKIVSGVVLGGARVRAHRRPGACHRQAVAGCRPGGRVERRADGGHDSVLRHGAHDRLAGERHRCARLRQPDLSTRVLPVGHVLSAARSPCTGRRRSGRSSTSKQFAHASRGHHQVPVRIAADGDRAPCSASPCCSPASPIWRLKQKG